MKIASVPAVRFRLPVVSGVGGTRRHPPPSLRLFRTDAAGGTLSVGPPSPFHRFFRRRIFFGWRPRLRPIASPAFHSPEFKSSCCYPIRRHRRLRVEVPFLPFSTHPVLSASLRGICSFGARFPFYRRPFGWNSQGRAVNIVRPNFPSLKSTIPTDSNPFSGAIRTSLIPAKRRCRFHFLAGTAWRKAAFWVPKSCASNAGEKGVAPFSAEWRDGGKGVAVSGIGSGCSSLRRPEARGKNSAGTGAAPTTVSRTGERALFCFTGLLKRTAPAAAAENLIFHPTFGKEDTA